MTVSPTSGTYEARHIASKATVYYNSACPVCNAGICAMQERVASDTGIEWIDVHRNPEALDALGLYGKTAVIGIAKKLEELYFPGDSVPVYLDKKGKRFA